MPLEPDLVVLSHLRWVWVWQRPQHLISRLHGGRRVWFVEEPVGAAVATPRLATAAAGLVTRVWLEVPDPGRLVPFERDLVPIYARLLPDLIGRAAHRTVWLYSPLTLDVAEALAPDLLVYDVMDDLASFKDAPPELALRQRQALRRADVVFAGGRTLHQSAVERGREDCHLFPSGVEPEHFERARRPRSRRQRPVAGYVGVIDERLDLDLVAGVAARLPDWTIRMVGPVIKIDPADLPQAPNIEYLGAQPYGRLPELMGGFDVALMPFAMNDATRSISPTKTLEYLAAGLPVVSTPVPDVVASFSPVVDLQVDADGFAQACGRVRHDDLPDRDLKLRPLLYEHHWDTIAERMAHIIEAASRSTRTTEAAL